MWSVETLFQGFYKTTLDKEKTHTRQTKQTKGLIYVKDSIKKQELVNAMK